jgi:hypothetical protein
VWKAVTCAQCQQPYAYLLELQATGADDDVLDLLGLNPPGAAQRAEAKAENNLAQKKQNCLLPVPCPQCGFYQADMARQLKEDAWLNPLQVAGAVVALLSLLPLYLGMPFGWVLAAVGTLAGLGLLAYGYVVAYRFDPNAGDPEVRKAIGRKHAVWGHQLAAIQAGDEKGTV